MEGKNKSDELISVAMQIIMSAGNARNLADEAFEYAKKSDFKNAKAKMELAHKELIQAHNSQTHIIQSEARGIKYEYSPLFAHAQDTLMTISSEINSDKKMVDLLQIIFSRKENA